MDNFEYIGNESLSQVYLIYCFSGKIEKVGIGYLSGFIPELFSNPSPIYWWNEVDVLKIVTWIGYVNIDVKACLKELSTTRRIKLKSVANL